MGRAYLIFEKDITIHDLQSSYIYEFEEINKFHTCDMNEFIKNLGDYSFILDEFEKQLYKKIVFGNNEDKKSRLANKLINMVDFDYVYQISGYKYYINKIIYENNKFNFYTYDNPLGLFKYVYKETFATFKNPEEYFKWIEVQLEEGGSKDGKYYCGWESFIANEIILNFGKAPIYFSKDYFEEYKKEFKYLWGDKPLNLVLYQT